MDQSVIAKFLERFVVAENGCWLWRAPVQRYAYGVFVYHLNGIRTRISAHRFAYQLWVGAISDGMTIDHRCHNLDQACKGGPVCVHRRCVNPDHLQAVSSKKNTLASRNAPAAINSRKMTCAQGHVLAGANLCRFRLRVNKRTCRVCRNQWQNRRKYWRTFEALLAAA